MQKTAIGSGNLMPEHMLLPPSGQRNLFRLQLHGAITKTLLVVKLTILLLTMAMLSARANGIAQSVTISGKDLTWKEVFSVIRKQTGHVLFNQKGEFPHSNRVSLSVHEMPLKNVLELLLKDQPFNYAIRDKTIILSRKPATATWRPELKIKMEQDPVKGKVMDNTGTPLAGASIKIKGSKKGTFTESNGSFSIDANEGDMLQISFIGYETVEVEASNGATLQIILKAQKTEMKAVEIISTGYQQISRERAVGSFTTVDNKLFNRSVSTNVLERLNGLVPGLQFAPNDRTAGRIETNPDLRNSGITIRGESTFLSSSDPLIVVDDFPFEGNISSINPNDIENITVLKDASAASIWGARSANGVIVITTKKGKKNEKLKLDFSGNLTVAAKPDLFHDKSFLDPKTFIEAEQFLFDKGYFNSDLTNTSTRTAVSPSIEIMDRVRSGDLTPEEGARQLSALAQYDIRNDMEKYVYRQSVNQQYAVSMRGGSENMTYRLGAGFDKNREQLVNNSFQRLSFNTLNTYTPVKNLDISVALNYAQSVTRDNNDMDAFTVYNGKYLGNVFPYTRFADDQGRPLDIQYRLRESYLQLTEQRGYQDWRFRPIDEINLADNATYVNSVLAKASVAYTIIPGLKASVNYQIEQQKIKIDKYYAPETFRVRDLVNKFTVYNAATQNLTYNYPLGAARDFSNYDWTSSNFRAQLTFNKRYGKHAVNALAGTEARELKTEGTLTSFIGYDRETGASVTDLNYTVSYPTSPSGSARLSSPSGRIFSILNRFISYYGNASYEFSNRYIFTASGRVDGANLFGAETNNKFTPLWSAGGGWKISNEKFYRLNWLPYLQIRTSFGYNGNIYKYGTALLTGRFSTDLLSGASKMTNLTPPNPQLKWERVKNINIGLDFETKNKFMSGTIEYYRKNGFDLIQPTQLAPQTGFAKFNANTGQTRSNGWDITLNTKLINNAFKWNNCLLLSFIHDEIVRYDAPYTSISTFGGVAGKPLKGIFAYRWAGLNPETGAPVGIVDGKNSEDYTVITNNLDAGDIVYGGSFTPTCYGSFRNDFSYRNIELSVNIQYSFGYVFRRRSMSTNYTALLTSERHSDYNLRWQKPGDELHTSVPSLTYPDDYARSSFYVNSEALITSADHIRLQDIRLGYDLSDSKLAKHIKSRLQVFAYASNLGIIWRKNKYGIDPNSLYTIPVPFSISFGVNANF